MRDPVVQLTPGRHLAAQLVAITRVVRERRRMVLLVAVPLIAAAVGLAVYLEGGRYISTDNAYVGAQKVLITPDVSGKIVRVDVREGEHVKAGDELLRVDPEPYQLAVNQAQAKLAGVRAEFAKLKADYRSLVELVDLSQKGADLKARDVERKRALVESRTGSQADLDTAAAGLVTQKLYAQLAVQQRDGVINQLLGDPDLPIEKFPAFMAAQAALAQAERDLAHTVLRAPINGTATQVDNIQLGRFVPAGTPMFSVINDADPWVEANPKETDITYLRVGQTATINVDTFPGHTFHGTVVAVAPGTGAQFAILPPQNANGNWVKVVQRVQVRIAFDKDENARDLRAGMSATINIDTHRSRSLAALFGLSPSLAEEKAK